MHTPAGNVWLRTHYRLGQFHLSNESYIGNYDKLEVSASSQVIRIFGPKYAPHSDTTTAHLEFALKYDDLHLGLLKQVFLLMEEKDLLNHIHSSGQGKYARKMGFLYEYLTGKELSISKEIKGNYVDLLDSSRYITGAIVKNGKWKINDNLLGNRDYCPIVRRTKQLDDLLRYDVRSNIQKLEKRYTPQVFRRALGFLYNKETRSSFEIERDTPSPDRMERFIALLQRAGIENEDTLLSEKNLTTYQNIIVDPRFANQGFRDFQNYIGEIMPNFIEKIHYICPPPQMAQSLMNGLQACLKKSGMVSPLVRASVISFGFVFIHPFEDGNGRIHRFLIHDMLVRDGIVPKGWIVPVSAHMLNNMKAYEQALETYSNPILQHIRYKKNEAGEIEIINKEEIVYYFQYPDLTAQCAYLAHTIYASVTEDMPNELDFIQMYDELKSEIKNIVDMPDKHVNQLILFLHQNKGVMPKKRRKEFSKLTDEEINKMENLYAEIFGGAV